MKLNAHMGPWVAMMGECRLMWWGCPQSRSHMWAAVMGTLRVLFCSELKTAADQTKNFYVRHKQSPLSHAAHIPVPSLFPSAILFSLYYTHVLHAEPIFPMLSPLSPCQAHFLNVSLFCFHLGVIPGIFHTTQIQIPSPHQYQNVPVCTDSALLSRILCYSPPLWLLCLCLSTFAVLSALKVLLFLVEFLSLHSIV